MIINLGFPALCLACSTLFIVRTPRKPAKQYRDINSMNEEVKTKVRFSSVTLFRETHTR
jgi:hypothetical protein